VSFVVLSVQFCYTLLASECHGLRTEETRFGVGYQRTEISRADPTAHMQSDSVHSPCSWLNHMVGITAHDSLLQEYESWWQQVGYAISDGVDRSGTPWLRMFDTTGMRVDEILYSPEYWRMLRKGYGLGVVWRAFKEESLLPSLLLIYITSFYDCGLSCPYTVSLSTALPISKYGRDQRPLSSQFVAPG
jgi:Adaptive response protein AidB N-terminal domain